jgi:chromate reductase
MSQTRTVAVIVGSLRRNSYSEQVAKAVAALAPGHLNFRIVEIGDLPFFNQDDEADPPAAWTRFRKEIAAADAVLFVTPEYNRGLPAVLKNAVDVGSRPYGSSVWNGKPGAVISQSPGAIGGFGANHQLRQSLAFLNVPTLQHEAYIGGVGALLDESGEVASEQTRSFLQDFGRRFAAWIERIAAEPGQVRSAA